MASTFRMHDLSSTILLVKPQKIQSSMASCAGERSELLLASQFSLSFIWKKILVKTYLCVSFQLEGLHRLKGASMSRIVRMTSETPVSSESIERLKRLAEMPDSEIRTDLIPEWTEEQSARARARRKARLQATEEEKLQKTG